MKGVYNITNQNIGEEVVYHTLIDHGIVVNRDTDNTVAEEIRIRIWVV